MPILIDPQELAFIKNLEALAEMTGVPYDPNYIGYDYRSAIAAGEVPRWQPEHQQYRWTDEYKRGPELEESESEGGLLNWLGDMLVPEAGALPRIRPKAPVGGAFGKKAPPRLLDKPAGQIIARGAHPDVPVGKVRAPQELVPAQPVVPRKSLAELAEQERLRNEEIRKLMLEEVHKPIGRPTGVGKMTSKTGGGLLDFLKEERGSFSWYPVDRQIERLPQNWAKRVKLLLNRPVSRRDMVTGAAEETAKIVGKKPGNLVEMATRSVAGHPMDSMYGQEELANIMLMLGGDSGKMGKHITTLPSGKEVAIPYGKYSRAMESPYDPGLIEILGLPYSEFKKWWNFRDTKLAKRIWSLVNTGKVEEASELALLRMFKDKNIPEVTVKRAVQDYIGRIADYRKGINDPFGVYDDELIFGGADKAPELIKNMNKAIADLGLSWDALGRVKVPEDRLGVLEDLGDKATEKIVNLTKKAATKAVQETGKQEVTRRQFLGLNLKDFLKSRAKGGPVKAGEPYLVGEEGPEVVIPEEDSTVEPIAELRDQAYNLAREKVNYITNILRFLNTAGEGPSAMAKLGPEWMTILNRMFDYGNEDPEHLEALERHREPQSAEEEHAEASKRYAQAPRRGPITGAEQWFADRFANKSVEEQREMDDMLTDFLESQQMIPRSQVEWTQIPSRTEGQWPPPRWEPPGGFRSPIRSWTEGDVTYYSNK